MKLTLKLLVSVLGLVIRTATRYLKAISSVWTIGIPPCMQVAYAQGAFYLAEIEKPVKYYGDIYYLNHGGKPYAKVIGNIYDDLSY